LLTFLKYQNPANEDHKLSRSYLILQLFPLSNIHPSVKLDKSRKKQSPQFQVSSQDPKNADIFFLIIKAPIGLKKMPK
jgi:hypothetical protein